MTADAAGAGRADEGFPKESRILRRPEYQRTYRDGRKIVTSCLVFFVRPNGGARNRLGITATRRCGNAVARNRIRRRVREAFRRGGDAALPPAEERGLDVVANVKPEAADASVGALLADFGRLGRKVGGGRA